MNAEGPSLEALMHRLAECPPEFLEEPAARINVAAVGSELVRFCLRNLGLGPAGESVAQAQDRLTTLDSVELRRVLQDTKKAEERARAIREALAKKAAEEAAAKVTRE